MDKNIISELKDILHYYKDTYQVNDELDEVLTELIANDVEVNGNSFYCPIWSSELSGWVLLAGTKEKADTWVLKRIVKLLRTGVPVYSIFNGNSDYLLKIAERYGVTLLSQDGDIANIAFNIKGS